MKTTQRCVEKHHDSLRFRAVHQIYLKEDDKIRTKPYDKIKMTKYFYILLAFNFNTIPKQKTLYLHLNLIWRHLLRLPVPDSIKIDNLVMVSATQIIGTRRVLATILEPKDLTHKPVIVSIFEILDPKGKNLVLKWFVLSTVIFNIEWIECKCF